MVFHLLACLFFPNSNVENATTHLSCHYGLELFDHNFLPASLVLSSTSFASPVFFPKHTFLFSDASVFEREGMEFFKGLSL